MVLTQIQQTLQKYSIQIVGTFIFLVIILYTHYSMH